MFHLGSRAARQALSRLKLVRIGTPVTWQALETLADKIRDSFLQVIGDIELIEHEPPRVESIDARILTRSLDGLLGGHILAITEADLVGPSGDDFFSFMFGGKDDTNDVAVVSTHRLKGRNSEVAGARLLKVALHELGHNFGLLHHYEDALAADGGHCPMSKGDFNRFGERGYVRAVIDARGFRFCRTCERFLQANFAPAR